MAKKPVVDLGSGMVPAAVLSRLVKAISFRSAALAAGTDADFEAADRQFWEAFDLAQFALSAAEPAPQQP